MSRIFGVIRNGTPVAHRPWPRFVVDAPPHTITARLPIERARGIAAGHHVSIDLAMEEPMLFPAMR